jgi:hypothetical protein
MAKLFYDFMLSFEKGPFLTFLLGVVLAAAWMTDIHLSSTQTQAAVLELSKSVQVQDEKVWLELNKQRDSTNELLRSIDQRLSRIEGKLEK